MDQSSTQQKTPICLSLGSNLGDRAAQLARACELISERAGVLTRASSVYQTPPWGYQSTNPYYNACLLVSTVLDPEVLMEVLLGIEEEMGRSRKGPGYADRCIDIDLLLYGTLHLESPRLKVPHPGMGQRRFVLQPLAEIAADLRHPVSGKTISALLKSCPDTSDITLIPGIRL